MLAGALTKTSTTTLSGKFLRHRSLQAEVKEGAHVAVFRAMAQIFREEGRRAFLFGVAGDYHGCTSRTYSSALHN